MLPAIYVALKVSGSSSWSNSEYKFSSKFIDLIILTNEGDSLLVLTGIELLPKYILVEFIAEFIGSQQKPHNPGIW